MKVPLENSLYSVSSLHSEINSSQLLTKVVKDSSVEKYFTKLLFCAWGRGLFYLAFEYAPGLTLFQRIEKEREERHIGLPIKDIFRISQQMLEALDYLFLKGFIHYDLKPDNVVDDGSLIKIVDYGSFQQKKKRYLPRDYFTARTYRSPEHVFACADQGRHDLWSLAVMLYELFADSELFGDPENELRLVSSWISKLGSLPHEYKRGVPRLINRLSLRSEREGVVYTEAEIVEFLLKGEKAYQEKLSASLLGSEENKRKVFFREAVNWERHLSDRSQANPESYENLGSSEKLFDLIWKLLQYLPRKRISASGALKRFFISSEASATRNYSSASAHRGSLAAASIVSGE